MIITIPFRSRGMSLENSVKLLRKHNVLIVEQLEGLNYFCQILSKDKQSLKQVEVKLKESGIDINQKYTSKTYPEVTIMSVHIKRAKILEVLS